MRCGIRRSIAARWRRPNTPELHGDQAGHPFTALSGARHRSRDAHSGDEGISCSAMSAPPGRRRAILLLLAALAQPAWAAAHAAVHEHLALHHGGATHSQLPASTPDVDPSGTSQVASVRGSHDHDHAHLAAVFVRSTRGTGLPSPVALPATVPCPSSVVVHQRWHLYPEAAASRASPDAAGSSDPRAPPIA